MVVPYYPEQVPWTDKENWVSPENPGDLAEADNVNQLYAEVNAIRLDIKDHKDSELPHITADGNYRYGFKVDNGELQFVYEEVV